MTPNVIRPHPSEQHTPVGVTPVPTTSTDNLLCSHPQPAAHGFTGVVARASACAVAGALAGMPSGCTGSLNTSDDLLGAEPLPALVVAPVGFGDRVDAPSLNTTPGSNGWDRRHWEPIVVAVPRAQTETQTWYGRHFVIDRSLPRQRGSFPIDAEVLDTFGDPGDAALEGLVNLAAAPPMLLIEPPLRLVREGLWPWSTIREPSTIDRSVAGEPVVGVDE